MLDIVNRLCCVPGAPGLEGAVVERAGAMLMPFVDRIEFDRLGNLLGFRASGRVRARTLLLDAHLDEVGFMVTGHEQGFLRFRAVGGIDPRILPGRVILFGADAPILGLVTTIPPHLVDSEASEEVLSLRDLYIDVGLSQEASRAALPVGTRGIFEGEAFPLGESQISGHALDNRVGFAVLLRTMELLRGQPLTVDIVVFGSVQEEVGARGAAVAAYAISPDVCVVVDVTHGHTPGIPRHKTFALGGGPCVGIGPGCHHATATRLMETARAIDISYQTEVMEGNTGTNAWTVQVAGGGTATAMLSIPLKYMHTPIETVSPVDMENTAQLLCRYILSLEGEV